jgi:hypothetical protein
LEIGMLDIEDLKENKISLVARKERKKQRR